MAIKSTGITPAGQAYQLRHYSFDINHITHMFLLLYAGIKRLPQGLTNENQQDKTPDQHREC